MRSIVSRPRAASRRSPLAVIDPSGNASAAATLNRIGSLSAISAWVMLAERRTILFSGPDLPALSRRRLFLRQKLLVRVPVGGRVTLRKPDLRSLRGSAQEADYAVVRELVAKLFAEGIEATVPETIRETVAAVGACVGGGVGEVSLTALAKRMRLDKNSVHHRVRKAIGRGYLINREEKRGMPARIAIADPLPDEIEILPILDDCWSVGASTEGIKKEKDDEDEESNAPTPPQTPSADLSAPVSGVALSGTSGNEVFDNDPDPIPDCLLRAPALCDYCGQPTDYQPLRQVGDGTRLGKLHRRCEVPWAYGEPGHSDASLTAGSSAFA